MPPKRSWASKIKSQERHALVGIKLDQVVKNIYDLIDLHENNTLILYSPTLRGQIPHSLAANAYNTFQDAMQRYEIVRVCAFWDKGSAETFSIPSVVDLLDSFDDLGALEDAAVLRRAIADAREMENSDLLRAAQNARNKYLAHSLSTTRAERGGRVNELRHGDEEQLLERTLEIISSLRLGVSGTNWDWTSFRDVARRDARELWGNCTFAIDTGG